MSLKNICLIQFITHFQCGPEGNLRLLSRINEVQQAVAVMDHHKVLHLIPAWFAQALQDDVRRRIVPTFWKYFDNLPAGDPKLLPACFTEAISYLHQVTQSYQPCIQYINSVEKLLALKLKSEEAFSTETVFRTSLGIRSLENILVILYKSFLFFTFRKLFRESVEKFYAQAFKVFHKSMGEEGLLIVSLQYSIPAQMCVLTHSFRYF